MKNIIISLLFTLLIIPFIHGQNKLGKYIPLASREKLDSSRIQKMTSLQLKLIRNEVFAFHGYIFNTTEMKIYFGSRSWYEPKLINVDHLLTELEKSNIKLIKDFEETGFIDISAIYKTNRINTNSFFEGNEKLYKQKSITYEEIYTTTRTERKSFIIQKIDDYATDKNSTVDAPLFSLQTLNIFTFNKDGQLDYYKTLKVNEGSIKIKSIGTRLFYVAKTYPIGTGNPIFKLVDIQDGFPFVISKRDDQLFEIKTPESTRWISYYEYAQSDWIYDQRINFIEKEDVRFNRVGSILYSDLDNVYQILDIYIPYKDIDDIHMFHPKPRISLLPLYDDEKFEFGYKNKEVFVDDYSNIVIEYQILGHSYRFPVVSKNIDISIFEDQEDGLFVRIREFE